jgi:hypothetical protein
VTPGELAEILERIEAKQDWLVSAVKQLLALEAGVELPTQTDPLEEWLAEVPLNGNGHAPEGEYIAPVHGPKPPQPKACPHNQQAIIGGLLTCQRCGFVWGDSGVVQNRVGNDGSVVPDPHPPQWATEHSPGASSKNPGTPLVPY